MKPSWMKWRRYSPETDNKLAQDNYTRLAALLGEHWGEQVLVKLIAEGWVPVFWDHESGDDYSLTVHSELYGVAYPDPRLKMRVDHGCRRIDVFFSEKYQKSYAEPLGRWHLEIDLDSADENYLADGLNRELSNWLIAIAHFLPE